MDKPIHDMQSLFKQLGLANSPSEIEAFIQQHKPVPRGTSLAEADFWTDAQSAFITEEIAEDADWAQVVDELDVMLRA